MLVIGKIKICIKIMALIFTNVIEQLSNALGQKSSSTALYWNASDEQMHGNHSACWWNAKVCGKKNLCDFNSTKPLWQNVPAQNIGKCQWDTAAKAHLVSTHKSLQLEQVQCLVLIDIDVQNRQSPDLSNCLQHCCSQSEIKKIGFQSHL